MALCCVPNCNSKFAKGCGISFHEIPADEELRSEWLKRISRKNWQPDFTSNYDRVCSKHFLDSDYSKTTKFKRLLRNAVPSVFPDFSAYLQPPAKKFLSTLEIEKQSVFSKTSEFTIGRDASDLKQNNMEKNTKPRRHLTLSSWRKKKKGPQNLADWRKRKQEEKKRNEEAAAALGITLKEYLQAIGEEPKKPRTDQPSSSSDDVNVKLEFFESEDENQSQAGPSSSNPGTSYGYSSQQSTSGGNSSSLSLCDNTNDQSSSSSDRPFIEPEVVIKIKEEPLSDDEESILPTPISCPPPVSTSFKVGKKAVQQISMPHIAGVTTAPGVGTSTSFSFNTTHQQAASQTPMAAIAPTIQSPIRSSTSPADRSLPAIPIGNVATSTHRDSSSLATGVSSTETQQQQRDSLDTFGEYIAARLRVLDRTTQTIAQKMINDILFDAEMGRLKS